MRRPLVWMFSGQGAQYYQMGAPLLAAEPVFRETVEDCSRRLEPLIGLSLRDLLYQPRPDRFAAFDRTLHTHPALFVVQYALARLLESRGQRPDYVLGYSLGEFVAYTVAGCLALDTALSAVVAHARLMEEHAPPGAMLAVVDSPAIRSSLPAEFAGLELAADNYARHFAVSGPRPALERLHAVLRDREVNSLLLPVRFAFHSAGIEAAAPAFRAFVAGLPPPAAPRIPIISAARARVVRAPAAGDLWRVARDCIRFRDTIEIMEDYGAFDYADLGPAGTLAAFVKYNLRPGSASRHHAIMSPFQRDAQALQTFLGSLHV